MLCSTVDSFVYTWPRWGVSSPTTSSGVGLTCTVAGAVVFTALTGCDVWLCVAASERIGDFVDSFLRIDFAVLAGVAAGGVPTADAVLPRTAGIATEPVCLADLALGFGAGVELATTRVVVGVVAAFSKVRAAFRCCLCFAFVSKPLWHVPHMCFLIGAPELLPCALVSVEDSVMRQRTDAGPAWPSG